MNANNQINQIDLRESACMRDIYMVWQSNSPLRSHNGRMA